MFLTLRVAHVLVFSKRIWSDCIFLFRIEFVLFCCCAADLSQILPNTEHGTVHLHIIQVPKEERVKRWLGETLNTPPPRNRRRMFLVFLFCSAQLLCSRLESDPPKHRTWYYPPAYYSGAERGMSQKAARGDTKYPTPPQSTAHVSRLLVHVFLPCLVLHRTMQHCSKCSSVQQKAFDLLELFVLLFLSTFDIWMFQM